MSAVADAAPHERQQEIQTAFKNVYWIWLGLAVNIGISFFLAPFVVRSLGNVYYGVWTLVNQFTGYLWLLDFGVRESVVKYVAQHHALKENDEMAAVVHAAVSLYGIIGGLVLLAVGGMTIALPHVFNIPADSIGAARLTLLIVGLTIAQGFVFNVYVGVLMGLQKFYLVDRLASGFAIVRAILIVAVLSAGFGIVALALVTVAITTAGNLAVYTLCRREVPHIGFSLARPRGEDVRRIVDYGKYVLVNNIGEKLVYASDGLVIGMFLPIASLTYFAIAASLIGYLKSIVGSMASVLNPMSSTMDSKSDSRGVGVLFLASAKAAVIVGLPFCIGFIVLGERFINLWMGPAYGPTSSRILQVLAVSHLAGLPYYTFSGVLYGLAQHRVVANVRLAEAVVNVALSVVLVQYYGLVGVAVGTLIPHVLIATVVLPVFLPRLLSVNVWEYFQSTYFWPLVAGIPFALVCLAIERTLAPQTFVTFLASVAAGLPIYAAACWYLAFSAQERSTVAAELGRLRARFARRQHPA